MKSRWRILDNRRSDFAFAVFERLVVVVQVLLFSSDNMFFPVKRDVIRKLSKFVDCLLDGGALEHSCSSFV
jgi:hypothetical protein